MTQVRFDVVTIQMNELHSQRRTMPVWETPIAIAVHSRPSVQVEDTITRETDVPDVEAEYQRLFNRYGADVEKGGNPFVDQIYGNNGSARLAEAIQSAIVTTKAPKKEIA